MAKSKTTIWLEYGAYRLIVAPLHLSPRFLWTLWGRLLGVLGHALVKSARTVARINVDLAFGAEKTPAEKRRIARASFTELGIAAVEIVNSHRLSKADLFRDTSGNLIEPFRESLAKGKGLIACCSHYGNWEWIAAYVSAHGLPVNAVVRPLDNPLLDRHLTRARTDKGMRILARKTSVRPAHEALARGEILALMADQNAAAGGVWVPFFGIQASTMRGPVHFAHGTGAPVRCAGTFRKADGGYEVWASDEIPMSGDEHTDLKRIHGVFEAVIRSRPEPWMWVHPRWKKRPRGEPSFYPGLRV